MKENIENIMKDLLIGQVIILKNKRYSFIEPKKKKAVVKNLENNKIYLISGSVEITDEIDKDTVIALEEETINNLIKERKIKKMIKGQHFIGEDDKEYILKKINRATVDCINYETKETFRVKFAFIKNILEKIEENT